MKELRKLLLTKVGEKLAARQFVAKIADQRFVRAFPEGMQSLHLAFIKHPTDFDVTADVGVRLAALEDMRNAMDPTMTRKGKNQSSSIGCELGNLVNGRPHTWTVTPATDIDAVADCIVEFFVSHGLPYLEKYSSPDAMFNLIAPNPERPCLDSPFLDKRAINVVGLALLLNRSQDIPCLVNQYEARLEAAYPFGLQGFRDFVAANV